MIYNPPYQPPRPHAGQYLIRIMDVYKQEDYIILYFDIAVGPSVGYAYAFYLQGGKWPLAWRIHTKSGQTVIQYALRALNDGRQPPLTTILDAAGRNLTVDIDFYNGYFQVRRSYPASAYHISPADIRIGTTSWQAGTKDVFHATLLAHLSGLPVLCADTQERQSPMVDWCAENKIILLPSSFPAGDYTIPTSSVIVDRKADLFELNRNFAPSPNRARYENAACYAAALGKQLTYLIGVDPDDHVSQMEDLRTWNSRHPKITDETIDGNHLYTQLTRYMQFHPNTDFRFIPKQHLCESIYQTVITGNALTIRDAKAS